MTLPDTFVVATKGYFILGKRTGCGIMGKRDDPLRVRLAISHDRGKGKKFPDVWIGLGDTVTMEGRTWRFEDIHYGNTCADWWIELRQLTPDTPPFTPPPMTGDRVWNPVRLQPFGGLSEEQLLAVERDLGRALPSSYRRWLAETNGATVPEEVTIKGMPFTLAPDQALLGVHPETPHQDLRFGDRRRALWVDESFVVAAIATGGLVLVGTRDNPFLVDRVMLLTDMDAYRSEEYRRYGYTDRTSFLASRRMIELADGFHEFCAYLQPAPPLPPATLADSPIAPMKPPSPPPPAPPDLDDRLDAILGPEFPRRDGPPSGAMPGPPVTGDPRPIQPWAAGQGAMRSTWRPPSESPPQPPSERPWSAPPSERPQQPGTDPRDGTVGHDRQERA